MKLIIKIDLDNDAFKPDPVPELKRILRDITESAELVDVDIWPAKLMDANGNTVGKVTIDG